MSLRLRALSLENIQSQSSIILEKLKVNDHLQKAKTVGLYMNMPSCEVQTMGIIEYCFLQQKSIYLPRCSPDEMSFLKAETLQSVYEMEPVGRFRIREPKDGADLKEGGPLDVLLMPGVAFTKNGKRLGRGAAYYDKFLNQYLNESGSKPYLIGLSLEEQLVDEIPVEGHDWALDEVVSSTF